MQQIIDQLVRTLGGDDWSQVEVVFGEINAAGLWNEAVSALVEVAPLSSEISMRFLSHWSWRGHRIREQVKDDEKLLNALRNLLPQYQGPDVSLFRGENVERWKQGAIGFSWTERMDVARMFARGLNAAYGDGGFLLSVTAPTQAIIAAPSAHSIYLDELEYLVDPRHLRDIEIIESFPRA